MSKPAAKKCYGDHTGWAQASPRGPWKAVCGGMGSRAVWLALWAVYALDDEVALMVLPVGQHPDNCYFSALLRGKDMPDWERALLEMEK